MVVLSPLPATFHATRDSLHAVACYAISPARKARTGRIGLVPTETGFATPPFDDRTRIEVRGAELVAPSGTSARFTTLRAATGFLGAELSADPGVGADLPPFEPDEPLTVDEAATLALGRWYTFGSLILAGLAAEELDVSDPQLWPEHFDVGVQVHFPNGSAANIGFSPGDEHCNEPYVYVGPHDRSVLAGDAFWNAPFGALVPYSRLLREASPAGAARAFVDEALGRTGRR